MKKVRLRLIWDGAPTSDTGKVEAYAETLRSILPGIRWREVSKGQLENEWLVDGVLEDISKIPEPSVADKILLVLVKQPGLVQHTIPIATVRIHNDADSKVKESWRLKDY